MQKSVSFSFVLGTISICDTPSSLKAIDFCSIVLVFERNEGALRLLSYPSAVAA
jgi:hypothetical protein